MQSEKILDKKQEVIEKAYEEPEEMREQLLKLLKPVIVTGNKRRKDVKPEKRLYKNLKESDTAEQIEQCLDEWENDRYD